MANVDLATLATTVADLQRRVATLELHTALALPTMSGTVSNILVKVGAMHLFWAQVRGEWLSVEDVKKHELELEWLQETETQATIEQLSLKVKERLQDGFQPIRTSARKTWENRRAAAPSKLPPVFSALPPADSQYPTGRGNKAVVVTFLRNKYLHIVINRNRKAPRYSAKSISDVLKVMDEDSAKASRYPNLEELKSLYEIIFGFPHTNLPQGQGDIEIEII
ncbi:hypothetical protein B0H16DRAFT_1614644 [Mycena metata]|uniref:Uncharacterized protein n=1 Tax=Mycena metata TaxID=1033252 RepID=A0AAD7HAN1_9AGAR|nr:hypothetical protein B0H16DRAFT_1614644 [Mycena metata]